MEKLLRAMVEHTILLKIMFRILRHFGDEDLKDIQLQVNGIVKKDFKKEPERKPIKGHKCGKSNEYDAEFCFFCNMALTQKRLVEVNERQGKRRN